MKDRTRIDVMDNIEYPKKGILSKSLRKSDDLDVTLFTMKKGSEIGEHTSTGEVAVHLIEGKMIFNIEGRNIKMSRGSIVFMKKNQIHSLKALENSAFLLFIGGLD